MRRSGDIRTTEHPEAAEHDLPCSHNDKDRTLHVMTLHTDSPTYCCQCFSLRRRVSCSATRRLSEIKREIEPDNAERHWRRANVCAVKPNASGLVRPRYPDAFWQ